MITSIEIGKSFNEFNPKKREIFKQLYYKIKSLSEGLVLSTDSNLVLIIGDNGSGKTTLITKMRAQLHNQFSFYHETGDFPEDILHLKFDETEIRSIHKHECPERQKLLWGFDDPENIRKDYKFSYGTYNLHYFNEFIDNKIKKETSPYVAFAFDQPEDGISLKNKRKIIQPIKDIAFDLKKQVFVVTNEKEFLMIPDSIIINLDDKPAKSYKQSEFDIEKYLSNSI